MRLTWFAADGRNLGVTVYRRTMSDDWGALGHISGNGTGEIVYEDTDVSPGTRYGYGLGVLEAFIRGEVDISGNLYVLTYLRDYVDVDLPWWHVLRSLTRHRLFQTISRAAMNVRSHYDISQTGLETYLDARYMAYSCAMFDRPGHFDAAELTRVGLGEADDFDSLEKAQWRKFKDALDFIAPSSRDTLLDVGCGYGGQLAVALKSYPFEKVVGCTHSSNQLVKGRTMLARFPADRWEINQRDYRQDDRVFSHITSTGMACHVGPRGLVPYTSEKPSSRVT